MDGASNQAKAEENKKILAQEDLTVAELDRLVKDFESSAQDGSHGEHGWHNSAYGVSKVERRKDSNSFNLSVNKNEKLTLLFL